MPSRVPGSNVPNGLCRSARCALRTCGPSMAGDVRCSCPMSATVATSAQMLAARDHGLRLYRTAGKDVLAVSEVGQVGDRVAYLQLGRPVQDDAERSFGRVLHHQHDGPVEVGVEQDRGGDEEVALQGLHPEKSTAGR